jgi:HlyD family secretion protein
MHPSPPNIPQTSPGAAMDRRIARGRFAGYRRPLRIALAAAAACALALAAVEFVPASGTLTVAADRLTVASVRNAPFQDFLPVHAAAAPLRTTFVGAIEGGQVASVAAQDGALVQAGDVLARLSNPQLQLDVTSREAAIAGQLGGVSAQRLTLQQNLTTGDTAIAEASYALLKAQRELQIRQRLHDADFESDAGLKGFRDEATYQSTRLALLQKARARDREVARSQGAEIDETAARLHRNLDVVEASLQALVLRAPVAGRLTNFLLQPGQTLKQGDPVGQIDSEGAWRLDADVDEFYLGRVAVGQHATADIDGAPVGLTVARVKPQVANGTFRAELTFDGAPPAGLRRGESTECRITLGATRTATVLPNGAWLESSGGATAFVLDSDGRHARRRAITTGRRNPEQVEILSGLAPGERVLISATSNYDKYNLLNVD